MKLPTAAIDSLSHRLFQFSFVSLALFIPFSIAGANFAIGFGLLAWLLSAMANRSRGPVDRAVDTAGRAVTREPLFLGAVLLTVSAVPSVLISEDIRRAFGDWRSYWLLSVCFLVAANAAVHRLRSVVFWVLFSSISASCLVALVQRAGGFDLGFIHIGARKRVESTLYTMTFAGILYQTILLCLSMAMRPGARWRDRTVLWAGTVLQSVAIVLTVTRGAWLALLAGLVAVCLLIRNRTVALFGITVLAAVLIFAFVNARHTDRNVSPLLLARQLDVHASTRLVLWDIAWELFLDNPVLGVGMGDYTTEADARVGDRTVTTTTDTHNVYLQVLATRGLVGFLPFVLFWWFMARSLLRARNAAPGGSWERHCAVGAIGATVAILVGALTENNVDDEEVFIAYMFITGLALSGRFAGKAVTRAADRPTGARGGPVSTGGTGA